MKQKIFALYNGNTIRVYQAYNDSIADEALELGTFGSYFSMDRMTWIKPSFRWMMYRAGWATKEGQNRILAIDMQREGFDYIVKNAVLSSFSENNYENYETWRLDLKNSEIRCQWDPERDIYGNPQKQRTIQLGIKGNVVKQYVQEWIAGITDITPKVIFMREAIKHNKFEKDMLPVEVEYFL